jgi:DNA mismatch repair ATPase MutS
LVDVDAIESRLCAVDDILSTDGLSRAFNSLARVPDLERKMSRIRACAGRADEAQGLAEGAAAVRRVSGELMAALDGFGEVERFRQALADQSRQIASPLLMRLIASLPNLGPAIQELVEQFDVCVARAAKSIVLNPGFSGPYDEARTRKATPRAVVPLSLIFFRTQLHISFHTIKGGAFKPKTFELTRAWPGPC